MAVLLRMGKGKPPHQLSPFLSPPLEIEEMKEKARWKDGKTQILILTRQGDLVKIQEIRVRPLLVGFRLRERVDAHWEGIWRGVAYRCIEEDGIFFA